MIIKVDRFESNFMRSLPVTYELLSSANLYVHPAVSKITIHGSRGPADDFEPNSDVDLYLIVEGAPAPGGIPQEELVRDVITTTLLNWNSSVELDLAVAFKTRECDMRCFDHVEYDEAVCSAAATDCFGVYKIKKGFSGYVKNSGMHMKRMYPCMVVWKR